MDFLYELFLRNYTRQKISFMRKELGFESLSVDLEGHKIFFLRRRSEVNSGKSLLLIHGLLDSATGFRRMAPFLRKDYDILMPDIPGFGLSPLPPIKFLYQIDTFSQLLYNSIRKLDLKELVLGGHSMGGLIAMLIAIQDSNWEKRIKKLVLLAPGGIPHPKRDEMKELLFPSKSAEIERLLSALYKENAPQLGWLAKKALLSQWNNRAHRFLTENTLDREKQIFIGQKLSAVKQKTLIVSGTEDPITDPPMVKKLHGYITHSKLIWIQDVKHALHMEKPREVSEQINAWL
ncbi:alpha/beta hydrolase [Leptospira langatensis]|uniref:Alpha/beta hydrolase n=1 Tax=Leptospira langatensis TaxID=2484983 RepID=A0A5F1ZVS8_9LEPT|nr:alpha/beta hydrolase [Leptospira langatensis]TGK01176.1 alpha/beta hydrolase [Leptospira langatensis]TGL42372.1 alpha/beta hydrolase [Leptospira langatensis]